MFSICMAKKIFEIFEKMHDFSKRDAIIQKRNDKFGFKYLKKHVPMWGNFENGASPPAT